MRCHWRRVGERQCVLGCHDVCRQRCVYFCDLAACCFGVSCSQSWHFGGSAAVYAADVYRAGCREQLSQSALRWQRFAAIGEMLAMRPSPAKGNGVVSSMTTVAAAEFYKTASKLALHSHLGSSNLGSSLVWLKLLVTIWLNRPHVLAPCWRPQSPARVRQHRRGPLCLAASVAGLGIPAERELRRLRSASEGTVRSVRLRHSRSAMGRRHRRGELIATLVPVSVVGSSCIAGGVLVEGGQPYMQGWTTAPRQRVGLEIFGVPKRRSKPT